MIARMHTGLDVDEETQKLNPKPNPKP